MPVMSPALCIGAQPLVYIPPLRYNISGNGNSDGRYSTRVSMKSQPLRQRKFPLLQAAGTGALHSVDRKEFCFVSKSKRSVFACNSALNAKCSHGQTQTLTRPAPTIKQAPIQGKEKSPKLDDGGNGFPPRDDGGGGGGGGGGENFSGGFFLFGFLLFMGYLKDMEGEHEKSH